MEGWKPETNFFPSLFAGTFSIPRFFQTHHVIELDASFRNHYFSARNNQNCDQGIILKEKRRIVQTEIWMRGIESFSGQTLKHGFRWALKGATRV